MSRFCFCNCPAGFSADPERHAPDCPGRSGAGKARTPVPATTPALTVSAAEELDAVLHWRNKHAQAIRERDALQQRLTAADERADVLEGFLRISLVAMKRIYLAGEDRIIELGGDCDSAEVMMEGDPAAREIRAALKPVEGQLNQCDGCQAGIPVVNGAHRMGKPGG